MMGQRDKQHTRQHTRQHGGDRLTHWLHLVAQGTNRLLWPPTEPPKPPTVPAALRALEGYRVISADVWQSQTLEGNEWRLSTTLSVSDGSSVLLLNGNPVGAEEGAVKKRSRGVQWEVGGSPPTQPNTLVSEHGPATRGLPLRKERDWNRHSKDKLSKALHAAAKSLAFVFLGTGSLLVTQQPGKCHVAQSSLKLRAGFCFSLKGLALWAQGMPHPSHLVSIKVCQAKKIQLGVVAHTFHSSTWEAETRRIFLNLRPTGLHSKLQDSQNYME